MAAIDQYLTQVLERSGSDLHYLAGDPPRVRQYGDLKALGDQPLSAWQRRGLRRHAGLRRTADRVGRPGQAR